MTLTRSIHLLSIGLLVTVVVACRTPVPVQQPTIQPTIAPTTEPTAPVVELPQEDPVDIIHRVRFEEAKIVERSDDKLPEGAVSTAPFEEKKPEDAGEERPTGKIHPVLQKWLDERPGDERERVIVSFRDDMRIPRLPDVAPGDSRESAAYKRAAAQTEEMIGAIAARRAPGYEKWTAQLASRYDAKVDTTFWLINGVRVEMPLGQVQALAKEREVTYLEPDNSGEEPPQDTNPNNDVDDGRADIVSDPYFALGQFGGWIGLLDTGLRFSHQQFNSPSHVSLRYDCTDGSCNATPDPADDCWNHGTSTAAIITGNDRVGAAYRGVTGVTLDSFKVYPAGCGGLSQAAVVDAFQDALAVFDRVIVAEMQGTGSDTSAISTAADNAFDAGAVIIAANGNNGPSASTVNTPANAHKAIGVGDFDVHGLAQVSSQSRGPAPDNRYKPDIQAPTNSETASTASDTALHTFGGTSGATPYASGAAALLRNWLRGNTGSIDPGQVYAQLILSGQRPYPFDNTSGAGPLRLPTDGTAWWGKVSVGNGATIDIPIGIGGASANTFDAALWWPETATQTHDDIDLYLIRPGGSQAAYSWSIPSVFERARVAGAVEEGTWKVRIRGYSVPAAPQTVYWAAHVRSR